MTPPKKPLSYHDTEFLDSDGGRPLRILAEYLQPLQAFSDQRVQETIVFFGSARIREDGPLGRYYREARELARLVTEWSLTLGHETCRFVVCTGGGPGLMEAANRGAVDAGGRTVGLNIGLPHEQRPNDFVTPELSFEFHYFFMRKLWFTHLARAMIAFPGGFGTLDELCEMLTLSQTGKLARPIAVLLYGEDFWREVLDFAALQRHGTIAPEDLSLFQYVNSPEEALVALKARLEHLPEREAPAFAASRTCSLPSTEEG